MHFLLRIHQHCAVYLRLERTVLLKLFLLISQTVLEPFIQFLLTVVH